ncbi:hypothetical protein IMCC1989_654 [gamma proteobacterium IMCC1989]|nr:hypothetical protein IMCC1989_654 [gamma proteobacterium IMCC1989]
MVQEKRVDTPVNLAAALACKPSLFIMVSGCLIMVSELSMPTLYVC